MYLLKDFIKHDEFRRGLINGVLSGGMRCNKPMLFSIQGKQVLAPFRTFKALYKSIFIDKEYFVPINTKNPKILDLGGNYGLSCLYFLSQFPDASIITYEADPEICEVLKYNIKKNGLLNNITVHNKAAWINDDMLEFSTNELGGGTISLNNSVERTRCLVESVDIKMIIESLSLDILKVDIEGAENELLPHIIAVITKVRYLIFEYHSVKNRKQRLGEVLYRLEEAGFRVHIRTEDQVYNPYLEDMPGNFDNRLVVYCENRKYHRN